MGGEQEPARDERPDVDARYQQAVMALTGQGGWPLTGFLTPDGDLDRKSVV